MREFYQYEQMPKDEKNVKHLISQRLNFPVHAILVNLLVIRDTKNSLSSNSID